MRLRKDRVHCWRTRKQQARNRRNNRPVQFQGRTIPLSEAAELAGVKADTITHRMNEWGCSFEEAIGETLSVLSRWTPSAYSKKLEAFLDEIEKNPGGTYGVFVRQQAVKGMAI